MLFNDVAIRGAFFRGRDILSLVNEMKPGARISLEREPENEHDAYAVKAIYDTVHIGYVAREVAAWLAPHMDEGTTFSAIVTSMQAGNRGNMEPWVSIASDEETLDLIEERVSAGEYEVGVDPTDEPAPSSFRLNSKMEPEEE